MHLANLLIWSVWFFFIVNLTHNKVINTKNLANLFLFLEFVKFKLISIYTRDVFIYRLIIEHLRQKMIHNIMLLNNSSSNEHGLWYRNLYWIIWNVRTLSINIGMGFKFKHLTLANTCWCLLLEPVQLYSIFVLLTIIIDNWLKWFFLLVQITWNW